MGHLRSVTSQCAINPALKSYVQGFRILLTRLTYIPVGKIDIDTGDRYGGVVKVIASIEDPTDFVTCRIDSGPAPEYFMQLGRLIDVFLADTLCFMLRISGLELLTTMRRQGLHTPVIVLCANSDVATAVAAMRAGADDFIEKPFLSRYFFDCVDRTLNRSHAAAVPHHQPI